VILALDSVHYKAGCPKLGLVNGDWPPKGFHARQTRRACSVAMALRSKENATVAILRVDPWGPEYGTSLELDPIEDLPQAVELDIEPTSWAPVSPPPIAELPCCAFVDGVRRIDVRLFAEEDTSTAPALAGSWAVGVAWSTQPVCRLERGARVTAGTETAPRAEGGGLLRER
jgi:hypothetical protein